MSTRQSLRIWCVLRGQTQSGEAAPLECDEIRKAAPSHAAPWKMIYGAGKNVVTPNFLDTRDRTFKSSKMERELRFSTKLLAVNNPRLVLSP